MSSNNQPNVFRVKVHIDMSCMRGNGLEVPIRVNRDWHGKRCSDCGEFKPLEQFPKIKNGKFGRRAICKSCHNKLNGERRKRLSNRRIINRPDYKVCTGCGLEKKSSEFYTDNTVELGLSSKCIKCSKIGLRNYRERVKERKKVRVEKKTCFDCGRNLHRSSFNVANDRADGLTSVCKKCASKRSSRWQRKNKKKMAMTTKRYHHRRNKLEASLTQEQWIICLEHFNYTCAYCGVQQSFWHSLEQEHVIPVSRGGGFTAGNIVPACKSCNTSKNDSDLLEWLKYKFGNSKAHRIHKRISRYFESLL